MAGFPGLSFGLAVLLSALVYLCVGTFEEVGRAYHIRNLLEGTIRGLGLKGATVVAVIGASTISVLMHSGNLTYQGNAHHGFGYTRQPCCRSLSR